MSAMTLTTPTTAKLRFTPRWNQFKKTFIEWRRRARSRRELIGMSERNLMDIGLSRCDASFEASKPFWME